MIDWTELTPTPPSFIEWVSNVTKWPTIDWTDFNTDSDFNATEWASIEWVSMGIERPSTVHRKGIKRSSNDDSTFVHWMVVDHALKMNWMVVDGPFDCRSMAVRWPSKMGCWCLGQRWFDGHIGHLLGDQARAAIEWFDEGQQNSIELHQNGDQSLSKLPSPKEHRTSFETHRMRIKSFDAELRLRSNPQMSIKWAFDYDWTLPSTTIETYWIGSIET